MQDKKCDVVCASVSKIDLRTVQCEVIEDVTEGFTLRGMVDKRGWLLIGYIRYSVFSTRSVTVRGYT